MLIINTKCTTLRTKIREYRNSVIVAIVQKENPRLRRSVDGDTIYKV